MKHQLQALNAMRGKRAFALLMEQGTGKTKVEIDDIADWWSQGEIEGVFVFAPNGVHIKWVTLELPKHMPDWVHYRASWYSSGSTKRHKATVEALFDPTPESAPRELRILAMNYDALNTADGVELFERFSKTFACLAIIDESQRIKNPGAKRTDRLLKARRRFVVKRILSGTPVTRAPFDVFTQFQFLDETILRTSSYTAFKSEYAEMLPEDHWLVKQIRKTSPNFQKKDGSLSKRIPQLIATDPVTKQPIYRNLDKLNRLIAPHSFRVLKRQCLDLPAKIYDTLPFEMTARQQTMYDTMNKQLRAQIGDLMRQIVLSGRRVGLNEEQALNEGRELIVQNKLAAMAKLQQITCGYTKLEDKSVLRIFKKVMDNPRNQVLMESVEDASDGGIIIWAPHRDKIDQIMECLREGYEADQIVRFDGAVGKDERMRGVDLFSDGKAKFFVGNPKAGGTGLTLNWGKTTYYYSDSFNLEDRLQSEDRNHRIGQDDSVRYYDLCAVGTIDETIAQSHQAKIAIANAITGDDKL
jgi:SNF2 family DNA or RNA helicase